MTGIVEPVRGVVPCGVDWLCTKANVKVGYLL